MKIDGNVQIGKSVIIQNDYIVCDGICKINGESLPPLPNNTKSSSVTMIGEKVFVNGYEWKNGRWKRTLRALWHWVF